MAVNNWGVIGVTQSTSAPHTQQDPLIIDNYLMHFSLNLGMERCHQTLWVSAGNNKFQWSEFAYMMEDLNLKYICFN